MLIGLTANSDVNHYVPNVDMRMPWVCNMLLTTEAVNHFIHLNNVEQVNCHKMAIMLLIWKKISMAPPTRYHRGRTLSR